jgi:type II secretory pathway pseudopilin PulG
MKKTQQSGFTPVVILLVLILVAVVGFAGYYVYNTQQNKKDDTKAAVANQTTTPAAQTTTDTQKYLVIKEWGVKIPVAAPIDDAYYVVKGDNVYFSTTAITNKYSDCAADKTTLYALGRYSDPNQEAFNGTMAQAYPNSIKIGNYWYYGVHPQSPCYYPANFTGSSTEQASIDAAGTAATQPAIKALGDAIAKVQAQ